MPTPPSPVGERAKERTLPGGGPKKASSDATTAAVCRISIKPRPQCDWTESSSFQQGNRGKRLAVPRCFSLGEVCSWRRRTSTEKASNICCTAPCNIDYLPPPSPSLRLVTAGCGRQNSWVSWLSRTERSGIERSSTCMPRNGSAAYESI